MIIKKSVNGATITVKKQSKQLEKSSTATTKSNRLINKKKGSSTSRPIAKPKDDYCKRLLKKVNDKKTPKNSAELLKAFHCILDGNKK